MNTARRVLLAATIATVAIFTASCLYPEKYDAVLHVDNNGTYEFEFDGTLTHVLVRAAFVEGSLTRQDEEKARRDLEKLSETPGFRSVHYLGQGRVKVNYETRGRLDAPFRFINKELAYISLFPRGGGIVEVKGTKLDRKTISQLSKLKMKPDGHLRVTTNGEVKSHNAQSEPWFFGWLGGYDWEIRSIEDSAPQIWIKIGAR